MSTTQNTKIIRFKAVTEGFDKLFTSIKTIADTQKIKLPESLQRTLVQYQNTITNIQRLFDKGFDISDSELQDIEKMLGSLNYSARDFLDKFASFKLPPEVLKSFTSINDELDSAQKKLRALVAGAAKYRGFVGKNAEGADVLTDKGYKEAFRQNFDASTKKSLLTVKKGRGSFSFSNFDALWGEAAQYDEIAEANGQLTAYQKNVIAARDEIRRLIDEAKVDGGQTFIDKFNERIKESRQLVEAQTTKVEELRAKTNAATVAPKGQRTQDIVDTQELYDQYYETSQKLIDVKKEETTETELVTDKTRKQTVALRKNNKTLMGAVTSAYAYHTALSFIKRTIKEAIDVVVNMDKALTGMAVVTTMSRAETWELVGSFQQLAKETGKTTTEIASMATKFYQQGKNTREVLELTEAAAKAATIAGIDGAQSIDLLTNAMNGFQMASSKAMEVSDKFAALAATSATDYEELATALSKVAAQANLAGMSMDFTLGMLAKGIEVTREAPETIGTALKTVISRMRELSDYGKTLEDGMDVNRVATALSNVGIDLMDRTTGQFRDLEEVFTEVGEKWDTLNKNQQANIAVAMAGTRQQSRFIAMMQDFDRTLELVTVSSNSYGATLAQQAKYMEGLEAKTTLMKNAWEELLLEFNNSEFVIGIIETITSSIDFLHDNMWAIYAVLGATLAIGAKNLIQGQIIAQQEFELGKQQTQLALEEKQIALDRLRTEKDLIIQKEIEAETADERAKLERALIMEEAAAQKKADADKAAADAKKAADDKRQHVERLKNIYDEAEANLTAMEISGRLSEEIAAKRRKQLEADAGKNLATAQTELVELEKSEAEAEKVATDAANALTQAQQNRVNAQNELNTATQMATKHARENYEMELKTTALEVSKLKMQKSNYTFSLRNLLLIGKTIIQNGLLSASQLKLNAIKVIEGITTGLNTLAEKFNTKAKKDNADASRDSAKASLQEAGANTVDTAATTANTAAETANTAAKKSSAGATASLGTAVKNLGSSIWKFVKGGGKALLKFLTSSAGGWAVAAVIAAAGIAQMIHFINKSIESHDRLANASKYTIEQLEELQVSLYNLTQEHNEVKSLVDEFEDLSSKLSKSAEEAQRLEEIVQSINDTEGRVVIDTNASEEEQLKQLRAYEAQKRIKTEASVDAMENVFAADADYFEEQYVKAQKANATGIGAGGGMAAGALGGAGIGAAIGSVVPGAGTLIGALIGTVVGTITGLAGGAIYGEAASGSWQDQANALRQKYIDEITSSEAGRQSIKAIGKQEIKGLEKAAESTQEVVLEAYVDKFGELWGSDGIDTEKFQNQMGVDEDYIMLLDKALDSETKLIDKMRIYQELNRNSSMSDSLRDIIPEMDALVRLYSMAGEEIADMGVSLDYLDSMWQMVDKDMKRAGKSNEDISDAMMKVYTSASRAVKALGDFASEEDKMRVSIEAMADATAAIINNSKVSLKYGSEEKWQEVVDELKEEAVQAQTKLDNFLKEKNVSDINELKNDDGSETEDYKTALKYQTKITDAAAKYAEEEEKLAEYRNQAINDFNALKDLSEQAFPVETVSQFTDRVESLVSTLERLSKATDLTSLSASDYMELLRDYPELIDSFVNGEITGGAISTIINKTYSDIITGVRTNLSNAGEQISKAVEWGMLEESHVGLIMDSSGNYDWDKVLNIQGMQDGELAQAMFNKSLWELSDLELSQMSYLRSLGDQALTARGQQSYYQNTYGIDITDENIGAGDLSRVVNQQYIDKINDPWSKNEEILSVLNDQLQLYAENSQEYADIIKQIGTVSANQVQLAADKIQQIKDKVFIQMLQSSEGALSGIVDISASGITINQKALDALYASSSEADRELASRISGLGTMLESLNSQVVDAYSESYQKITDFANMYIEQLEKQAEKEQEILEARKDSYESYFDAIDSLEDEQERKQKRESIVAQLSALSTGIGGNTQTKIKELQSQLESLNKEEAEARREDIRQELLDDIDEEIKNNNDALERNTKAINLLAAATLVGADDIATYYNAETGTINWEQILAKYSYADGGYVTHTGLAYVHGSRSKPESFLSAVDTENVRALLDAFNIILNDSSASLDSAGNDNVDSSSSITIENISIHTDQLNNTQDFSAAGNALAQEFAKIIRERGLNVNVKK